MFNRSTHDVVLLQSSLNYGQEIQIPPTHHHRHGPPHHPSKTASSIRRCRIPRSDNQNRVEQAQQVERRHSGNEKNRQWHPRKIGHDARRHTYMPRAGLCKWHDRNTRTDAIRTNPPGTIRRRLPLAHCHRYRRNRQHQAIFLYFAVLPPAHQRLFHHARTQRVRRRDTTIRVHNPRP